MRYVNLLIKPASSLCNMRCAYCFYADESEHRTRKSMGIMQEKTMRSLIRSAFDLVDDSGCVSFSFQGGEPTLAGLDYFRQFIRCAGEQNNKNARINWAVQTNGLNIDREWIGLFRQNRFLVGVSVDGDRTLHDMLRPDAEGQGTYDRVTEKIRMLIGSRVDTNILCVVTGRAAERGKQVYRALKSLNTGFLQFIPCLDPLGVPRGNMNWSLRPDAYGRFLCGVFDLWYQDWLNGRYVSVRQFDDWVHMAMGEAPGACASCGACGSYLVVEADGSLYPCDFYVTDEWRLEYGADQPEAAFSSPAMKRFIGRGREKPGACGLCRYFPLCRGGCPRDWYRGPDGATANYYCAAFRTFFDYAGARLLNVARTELSCRTSSR